MTINVHVSVTTPRGQVRPTGRRGHRERHSTDNRTGGPRSAPAPAPAATASSAAATGHQRQQRRMPSRPSDLFISQYLAKAAPSPPEEIRSRAAAPATKAICITGPSSARWRCPGVAGGWTDHSGPRSANCDLVRCHQIWKGSHRPDASRCRAASVRSRSSPTPVPAASTRSRSQPAPVRPRSQPAPIRPPPGSHPAPIMCPGPGPSPLLACVPAQPAPVLSYPGPSQVRSQRVPVRVQGRLRPFHGIRGALAAVLRARGARSGGATPPRGPTAVGGSVYFGFKTAAHITVRRRDVRL